MTRVGLIAILAALVALIAGDLALAQSTSEQQATLKRDVERRFEVIPLRGSVALRPKSGRARSVEFTADAIDIDGAPVTGAELRQKLGADADLVLRLSYLSADERQRLFAPEAKPAEAPTPAALPPLPAPPAPPEAPSIEQQPEVS